MFGTICIVVLLAGVSYASSRTLSVPQQTQSGGYTCWASTGSMISAFFKGNTTNYENTIFLYIKGPIDKNSPAAMGTVYDTVNGVKYVTNLQGSVYLTALSYTAVKYQINNNGPIAAALANISHMVPIKGYNDDSTQDVLYNDPADGYGHRATYSYFINTWGWSNSGFWK